MTSPGSPAILSARRGGCLMSAMAYSWPRDQDESDAGQHALDDGHGDGPEAAAEPQGAQGELEEAGDQDDGAENAEAEFVDGLEDQHGEAGGGAADLEGAAGQEADDQAADDAGDQAEFGGYPGGDGHAHAQGQGDQEDDEGGEDVPPHGLRIFQGGEHQWSSSAQRKRKGRGTRGPWGGRVRRHSGRKPCRAGRCAFTAPVCTS